MRKLISPIIHVAFLIPLTGIAVGIEALMRTLGVIGEYKGTIDLPLFIMFFSSIIIFGIPVFRLANLLMKKLENLKDPNIYDHFRQSVFYYMIVIYGSASWIASGFGNNEKDAYLLMWMGISLVGIAVNYIFLRNLSGINHLQPGA